MSLLMCGLTSFALAEDATEKTVSVSSTASFGGALAQMLLVLFLILALLLSIAWVLRRAGLMQASMQGQLRILGSVAVGPREKVILVQVGQEQLVLGVTASEINLLHLLAEPIEIVDAHTMSVTGGFAERLQQALQKR
jgi:flagellar protein FliO/FliZ